MLRTSFRAQIFICLFYNVLASDYYVEIVNDSPVVSGGTINFKANLYEGSSLAQGSFLFEWEDNAIPIHTRSVDTDQPLDSWSVHYPSKDCPPGPYIMQVTVYKYTLMMPWFKASQRVQFTLTETLNGFLDIVQDNRSISNEFVSNTSTVTHRVKLNAPDEKYLNKSATSILSYWFVDCEYYGMTDNYEFAMNYTESEKEHTVEVLVLADFTPLPPVTTTTTSTTTPATTTTSTTPPTKPTTTTTTTTKPKESKATNHTGVRRKRDTLITNAPKNESEIVAKFHGHYKPLNRTAYYNDSIQFICSNNTIIPLGRNVTYGYYSRKIAVREPISHVTVDGNTWIQPGELFRLSVSCKGSSSFNYCYYFKDGIYNITGNETCLDSSVINKCDFPIVRMFYINLVNTHTLIIIINNDVSKIVHPVAITTYKVNKQAQLSVIVVPVAFSLVAVVLVIFGVALYIQNRSRFIVEVADFNFGQQFIDMEYKSFTERLRDSIANAFTRAPIPGSSEGPVWPPGRKYGSMT